MNLFSFQRIRNRVFVNFFGIKFKYTSFNNFGKYRKPDYRYIIDLVSEISGKEVKNIDDRKIYVIGDSHSVFFCGQDFLSYKKLKEICECTDGNMATHLNKLIQNQFILKHKVIYNDKPLTTYHLTDFGKDEFQKYVALLQKAIETVTE